MQATRKVASECGWGYAQMAGLEDKDTENTPLSERRDKQERSFFSLSWKLWGPGLLVCLADTDAGCLIVASQSGARWGYSLLWLQVLLIPVLFMAQELTVRLGVYTRQGHTACIKEHFGAFWAWAACILLLVECVCAMMSEMSGVAAVAELWGCNRQLATAVSALVIVGAVVLLNYRQVEALGIVLGLFELTFVVSMFMYHPSLSSVLEGSITLHSDKDFVKLIAANIGAVVMPWMIYFQQSAVVARRLLTEQDLSQERTHTLVGSFLTQLIMIGALVTMAAAHSHPKNLETVKDIVDVIAPELGQTTARVLVSLGFLGGSLSAAFVVSLAASWAICEALGTDDTTYSLDRHPSQAPFFYGSFSAVVLLGTIVLLSGVDVVKLNVFVELMDGILLPFTIGFLFLLATGPALPEEARVKGFHKYFLGAVFFLCSALSIGSAVYGLSTGES